MLIHILVSSYMCWLENMDESLTLPKTREGKKEKEKDREQERRQEWRREEEREVKTKKICLFSEHL